MDPGELQRMVDDERADAAALERMRERSLLRQAREEGRLAGVLASLRARGWEASLQTTAGRTHVGPVVTVAADFCSLGSRRGLVHLPYAGIAAVRGPLTPGHTDLLVDPDPALSKDTLADLVARLVEDRARVRVGLPAGEPLLGTLVMAGADLVAVTGAAGGAPVSYVSVSAVVELSEVAEPSGRGSG